jgi:hypothetical protein
MIYQLHCSKFELIKFKQRVNKKKINYLPINCTFRNQTQHVSHYRRFGEPN